MTATDRSTRPMRRTAAVLAGWLLCAAVCPAQAPQVAPAPNAVLVSDLIVHGNQTIPQQRILAYVKTRPKQPFSQETVNEDVRRLYETKLFANVQSRIQTNNDGSVTVYFSVLEFPSPIQGIKYEGAKHLKKDDLDQITGLRRGAPNNPILNKKACQDIVRRYNEEGYPMATCEVLPGKGDRPGDTEVVFNVSEGPKVKVAGIDFVGNHFVTGGVLATHVNSSKEWFRLFGGTYNAAMADADLVKLEEYYRAYGFHDVRVSRELQWSPDMRHVTLVFHIQEGQRYHVQGTQVVGVHAFPTEEIDRIAKVHRGEWFDQAKVEKDVNTIKDYYGYTGRNPVVRPEFFFPEDEPGTVRVAYQVMQERGPDRVGQIMVIGNEVTRESVIRREIPLYPGQILTYPDVRVGERNLARLGIFEMNAEGVRPTITVLPNEDSEFKDVLVQVQETRTGSLIFGVGVNSDAGLTGSIVLNEKNFDITRVPTSFDDFLNGRAFRGAGQEFRAEAVPGTSLQRYSATWRDPRIFDSLFSLSVGGYYYTRNYNEYDESRLGTRITIGRKLNQYWSVNAGVRVENVGVHNVAFFAPEDFQTVVGNNFVVGFRGGVTRDTRDSFLRPTEGSLIDIGYEQVTGDFNYPIASIEANKYFTTWQRADGSGRHVLALRSQMSWAGSETPVYDRFYAGGFRSMRGFQFRGVGPNVNGFETGGDFMWLNSAEYQVPVKANDQIYLVAFVDSGTVEPTTEIKNYRVSAGFGVRFVVPMLGPVPIALDFGFPVVKANGDHEQVFSFWVGFFH